MNQNLEARQRWTAHFVETLSKVELSIRAGNIDPLVVIEVARAVSWHAYHGPEETSVAARRILASLPDSLEFRTLLALADGHGHILRHTDFHTHQANWNEYLSTLVEDLLQHYPDGETPRAV